MTPVAMKPLKILFLGTPGAGKTGALATLLHAGYKVRVLDFDNNLDTLTSMLNDAKSPYDKSCLERLSYITLTDPIKFLPDGTPVPSSATAWTRFGAAMMNWKDNQGREYGPVSSWDSNTVLVIDTLTSMSHAALNFHQMLQGKLGGIDPATKKEIGSMEAQRMIYAVQTLVDKFMQGIRSESVKCHVIVNSHILFCKPDGTSPSLKELQSEPPPRLVGLPASIGKAGAPKIPGYFANILFAERIGASQKIYTTACSDSRISLKSSAPLRVKDNYDLRTSGLAGYFQDVLQTKPQLEKVNV